MQTIFQDKDGVYWFGADDTSVITYNAKIKTGKFFQYKEKHDPDSLGFIAFSPSLPGPSRENMVWRTIHFMQL